MDYSIKIDSARLTGFNPNEVWAGTGDSVKMKNYHKFFTEIFPRLNLGPDYVH